MSDVIFYTTDDGAIKIDLCLENGTVCLSQHEIAELFQTTKQNISNHIQAIYNENSVIRKFWITTPDNKHYYAMNLFPSLGGVAAAGGRGGS